jgi:cytoskeletal protein RodZ
MDDMVIIIVRVLAVVLVGSIPIWIATRRARRQFRERFGRTPSEQELDSLGAWLKDPPAAPAQTPSKQVSSSTQAPADPTQTPPEQTSIKSTFGNGPRA